MARCRKDFSPLHEIVILIDGKNFLMIVRTMSDGQFFKSQGTRTLEKMTDGSEIIV